MMKEVKNIDKKSLANIMALVYGLAGFFSALSAAVLTMINIIMRKNFQGSAILVSLFNFGTGLLLGVLAALLTALIGWVAGFITAGIYNWFAKKVGGVRVELEDAGETAQDETKISN